MTLAHVLIAARRAAACCAVAFSFASPAAWAQQPFATPDAAVAAFIDAVATHDWDALRGILGKDYRRYLPDPIDDDDITDFLAAQAKGRKIVYNGPERAQLTVGPDGWVLPIPMVKSAQGWRFDMVAASDEIRVRRIGRNELDAAEALLAYYDAQKEYAEVDRNGDSMLEYAQRIVSTPGRRDGLVWDDGSTSPLGPLFTDDLKQGVYHGYRFRVLKAQGAAARGGARDYVVNGRMTRGFAAIAWPARWGDTGIFTFIVSHDGRVYQKNLGANTDALARGIKAFDPDTSWTRLTPRSASAQK